MVHRFLRTTLGTGYDPPGFIERALLRRFGANPDYEHHLVCQWLVEFEDDGMPWREIGLDAGGVPVLAGPDDRNYGYWVDTDMHFDDFKGVEVSREEFEIQWDAWQATRDASGGST